MRILLKSTRILLESTRVLLKSTRILLESTGILLKSHFMNRVLIYLQKTPGMLWKRPNDNQFTPVFKCRKINVGFRCFSNIICNFALC